MALHVEAGFYVEALDHKHSGNPHKYAFGQLEGYEFVMIYLE
jgi:hypothetical protein